MILMQRARRSGAGWCVSVIDVSLKILEPQADGIPQAAEPAGFGDFSAVEDVADRLAVRRLGCRYRSSGPYWPQDIQGLLADHVGLQLVSSPFGRDAEIVREAGAVTMFSWPFQIRARNSCTAWLAP